MSTALMSLSAAAPVAGWALHGWWMARRLAATRRDPLTGLPGRTDFAKHATRLLRTAPCAVVVIDLDGFKSLNDSRGHIAGDAALIAAGARLHLDLGTTGVVARLGGDEFAAVLPLDHPGELPLRLSALHERLCAPIAFEDAQLVLGASIGAVWTAQLPVPDVSLALRLADEAMYRAKQAGAGWHIAETDGPALPTVNGRREGRPGAALARMGRR